VPPVVTQWTCPPIFVVEILLSEPRCALLGRSELKYRNRPEDLTGVADYPVKKIHNFSLFNKPFL
ncbi:MAG: hypothetical protein PVJ20_06485, partial [Desulfobacterales bacterium]